MYSMWNRKQPAFYTSGHNTIILPLPCLKIHDYAFRWTATHYILHHRIICSSKTKLNSWSFLWFSLKLKKLNHYYNSSVTMLDIWNEAFALIWCVCFLPSKTLLEPKLCIWHCSMSYFFCLLQMQIWCKGCATMFFLEKVCPGILSNHQHFYRLFLSVLSWTLAFKILTEACSVSNVALVVFKFYLSIVQCYHEVNLLGHSFFARLTTVFSVSTGE